MIKVIAHNNIYNSLRWIAVRVVGGLIEHMATLEESPNALLE